MLIEQRIIISSAPHQGGPGIISTPITIGQGTVLQEARKIGFPSLRGKKRETPDPVRRGGACPHPLARPGERGWGQAPPLRRPVSPLKDAEPQNCRH